MKVIFLDRDDTINKDPGYLNDPNLVELLPNSKDGLRLLAAFGYKFIIITNQSGMARGKITLEQLEAVNERLLQLLAEAEIQIEKIYFCPDHPDNFTECRKPNPGMINDALTDFDIDLSKSYLIGDKQSDVETGLRHNIAAIKIDTKTYQKLSDNHIANARDLLEAAQIILEHQFDQTLGKKILNFKEAEKFAENEKQKGNTVVFTNGCFDILHSGHLQYLNQAAALGKTFILGLNGDSSIQALKGSNRPINKLADRATLLAGFDFIDKIVPFEDTTPIPLIQKLKPNIHVKGADYTIESLPEARHVLDGGGKIIILPFRKGYSTTNIIAKINS